MDEVFAQLAELVFGLKRRRWVVLAVAWPIAILGGIGVMLTHDRYEATAKVFVDTQTVLKPLMKEITFQLDIDQQVTMLAKTLISRPNVEHLLTLPGLGLAQGNPGKYDAEVDGLMKAIKIEPLTNNLYAITYRDMDSQRAKRMVQGLVDLFVDSGVGEKRRDSEGASRFIDEQIRTSEVKLAEAEGRMKDFKLRNFGVTGTSNQDYFGRVSLLSDEVSKLRIDLSAAEHARDAYKKELSAEDPQLPFDAAGGGGGAPSELDTRIESQKKLLDDLLRRYTDEHPDVVGTRRTITQLERQRKLEQDYAGRSGRGRGNAATSPVYQKIRVSLAEAEANVASLRVQLSVKQERLAETRATAGKLPEVEEELAQLNRDYGVMRKNYDQLVSRRESASLGVKLDQSAQLADFRIIEPTRVSPNSVFPNRLMLAIILLFVSLLIGAGVAIGLGFMFPTVHVPKDLIELSGRPVLGSVSMHISDEDIQADRRSWINFAAAGGILIALQVVWIGWIAMHAARA
ncbi:MAG: Wzz/FepE/Etk N-terminal domain-containing protein [Aquabacterium sp.]|nr:Wzz/FepE/Etk N-terminal domain-containing protein [Aquabacterium sp.]